MTDTEDWHGRRAEGTGDDLVTPLERELADVNLGLASIAEYYGANLTVAIDHQMKCTLMGRCRTIRLASVLALTLALLAAPAHATTIVSTSGIPHGDVGDYTSSPYWRPGMPTGANRRWRGYMRTVVRQVTATDPAMVIHSGDMVEGQWGHYRRRPELFGPDSTYAQRSRVVTRAGATMYRWTRQWWSGHRVAWGMGDHEIGDMGTTGVISAGNFRANAHAVWNNVWRDHFGRARHSRRVRQFGVIVLDPFAKRNGAVHAWVSDNDRRWMRRRARELRADGARWILLVSEIPLLRPPHSASSSNITLRNGWRVYRDAKASGVDLVLTGEVHRTSVKRVGGGPWQVTHGGRHLRASWLELTTADRRLQLVARQSRGRAADATRMWAMAGPQLPRRPIAGTPRTHGRATLRRDGRLTNRSGVL